MLGQVPKEVLLVEDEALTRIVTADAISEKGVMVWEASDADEALRLLDRKPHIGVLFTDVSMPGEVDGLELARRVHEARPEVELIVTSGAIKVDDEDLPDNGTFVQKPYRPEQIAQLVTEKLDRNQD
jgi:CheY-like chemotaxis protein